MKVAILLFLLLVGGLLQSLVPALPWLGLSKPPFLMAVALYSVLVHTRATAVVTAILAGVMQDSLSLIPVGYSSLCLVVFVLVLSATRATLFRDSPVTVAALGAVAGALMTLGLYLMLSVTDRVVHLPAGWVALKMVGGALQGLVTAPLVWWLASSLEHHVGLTAEEER